MATGSDDSIILIWQKTNNPYANAAFEAAAAGISPEGGTLSESYTVLHRLTGHESDVNGVAWSPDGRYFASCSLDGRIMVWDATGGYSLLRKLETDPMKPLKGLIWDPLGSFLAAQTSEGQLYVWRVGSWKLETIFNSPWADSVESYTYFSRPTWSPDGSIICVPDVLNDHDSVAILLERDQWNAGQSLVGHASSVQVASFSPKLYLQSLPDTIIGRDTPADTDGTPNRHGKGNTFMLIALGSQEGLVSIWSNQEPKPVAVIAGLFEHAVMDLTWSPDGQSIYACSYDGTVACIRISPAILKGGPLDEGRQLDIIGRLDMREAGRIGVSLPTSVKQITLQQTLEVAMSKREATVANPTTAVANLMEVDVGNTTTVIGFGNQVPEAATATAAVPVGSDASAGLTVNAPMPRSDKSQFTATQIPAPLSSIQKETTLKSGKRRITPQLLQPANISESHTAACSVPSIKAEQYVVMIGRNSRKQWLKVPPIRISLSLSYSPISEDSLEIVNTIKGSTSSRICRVNKSDGKVIWEDKLGTTNILQACMRDNGTLIVATSDNHLLFYSPAGRRMMAPIVLSSAAAVVEWTNDVLLILLDNGSFSLWQLPLFLPLVHSELPPSGVQADLVKVELKHLPHSSTSSAYPIASGRGHGQIFVEFCFSSGRSVLYSTTHQSFFDLNWKSVNCQAIIKAIWGEQETIDVELLQSILGADLREFRQSSLGHIEAQIAALSLMILDPAIQARILPWLLAYAQRLAAEECYPKAMELIEVIDEYSLPTEIISQYKKLISIIFASSGSPLIRRLAESLNK